MVSGNVVTGGDADCCEACKVLEDAKLCRRQRLRVGERQCCCFAQLQEDIIRQSTERDFIDVM